MKLSEDRALLAYPLCTRPTVLTLVVLAPQHRLVVPARHGGGAHVVLHLGVDAPLVAVADTVLVAVRRDVIAPLIVVLPGGAVRRCGV